MSDFTITVDGKEVPVTKGQTVLEASLAAGIEIPVFCWHPQLVPVGACRICLVEIEKLPKLQVSCATMANEGMVVHTNSPKVIKARQGVLEFILAHHPLDCPTCDKGGECDLQNVTFKYGRDYSRLKEPKHRYIVDTNSTFDDLKIGPEIVRNQNRCIHCYRCVRIVDEVLFEDDLGAYQRGHHTEILPPPEREIRNLYSGNVVEYCPVGALTNSDWRYKARVWKTKAVDSICTHCPDGCNIKLWTLHNRVLRTTSRPNDKIDKGFLCDVGRYGYQFSASSARLKQPMIRKEGELVETSWKEALSFISTKTAALKSKLSGSGFFGLVGAESSCEEIYAFQRLMRRTIGTNNIDHRLRRKRKLSLGAEVAAHGASNDQVTFADIEKSDLILILGSDLQSENPITALAVKRAVRKNGTSLVLANTRPTPLGIRTSDIEAIYKPGTEVVLLQGIIDAMLDTQGMELSSVGLDINQVKKYRDQHSEYGCVQASSVCGIESDQIEHIAERLVRAEKVMILCGRDVATHPYRDSITLALHNLKRFCKSAKLKVFRAESNYRGAELLGAQPDLLPGGVSIEDKARYEDLWKGPIPEMVGKDTIGILSAVNDDEIQCGFVFNADPVRLFPDGAYVKSVLEKLTLLIVVDTFLSDTARIADVILPIATFAETDATRVNWENRIQYSQQAIKPVHQSKNGCEIIESLAGSLGAGFNQASPADVYRELKSFLSGSVPDSYAGFPTDGCLIEESKRSSETVFDLAQIKYTPLPEDEQYPYYLIVGNADHHRGILSEKNDSLVRFTSDHYVAVSRKVAEGLSVTDGDLVRVESKHGKIVGAIRIEPKFPDSIVFLPENFSEIQPSLLMERHEKADLVSLTKM